jgi:hypothetical protein
MFRKKFKKRRVKLLKVLDSKKTNNKHLLNNCKSHKFKNKKRKIKNENLRKILLKDRMKRKQQKKLQV